MEKLKNYESFDIGDLNLKKTEKEGKNHLFFKISIALGIIIIFELIYLFVIYSKTKEKNTQISNINLKKWILEDGNKKLDRTLKESYEKDYAYDEESKKKDNEIKSKDKLIKDYIKKTYKLQKKLNETQPIEEILEVNNEKRINIGQLKNALDLGKKIFKEQFNTKIIDSFGELDIIKDLIKGNIEINNNDINFNKCLSFDVAEGKEINYDEISYAINFNENKFYLLIFQTNNFGRYGSIITDDENNDKYLVFDMNNKRKDSFEYEWMKFKLDRQSLKLFINTIKEYKFENKNKEFDYIKYTNVTELEVYKVY